MPRHNLSIAQEVLVRDIEETIAKAKEERRLDREALEAHVARSEARLQKLHHEKVLFQGYVDQEKAQILKAFDELKKGGEDIFTELVKDEEECLTALKGHVADIKDDGEAPPEQPPERMVS